MMKSKSLQDHAVADSLAVDVLLWMVQDPDRLLPFLNATGLTPDALRRAAEDPTILDAVLDHVMADEPVLLACARALEVPPERIASAWARRRPPDFEAP